VPVAAEEFTEAWEVFFLTTRRVRARANKLKSNGHLTLPQYHLLAALRDEDELTVGELAEAAGVAPPTATRMLDCLARLGYVLRRHSDEDRRVVLVTLTLAGRRALDQAHEVATAFRRRVFESLTPEEREQAAPLLRRLAEAMEEHGPP
jgi:MarR family transcriptional regulator, organic hydroperoxide resistance regulator